MTKRPTPTPADISRLLLNDIEAGTYSAGDALPTLDQLNAQYFGENRGPKPGRTVYAPLIAAGMVEARPGRYGGHFLIRTTPAEVHASAVLAPLTAPLDAIAEQLATLRAIELTVVEFSEIATGEHVGACLHSSRLAAEHYAITLLTHLGETHPTLADLVHHATHTPTDLTRYAISIHSQTLV